MLGRRLLAILSSSLVALALAACNPSERASPALAVTAGADERPAIRIPLPDYPPAFQDRVADELDHAPAGAAWPAIVRDNSTLRRQVCAVDPTSTACGRICAAEAHRFRWCPRARSPPAAGVP